jgi:hypothetical protein
MPQRIARFSVAQTAKVIAILYGFMGLLLIPFFYLASTLNPASETPFGIGLMIMAPIAYGLLGFVFTAIGCLLYNWVASWAGGIEVELDG